MRRGGVVSALRVNIAHLLGLPTAPAVDSQSAPETAETYSFELDDDLVKVVTLSRGARSCRVNVRYGGDYLLHEEDHLFPVDGPLEIQPHAQGLTLRSRKTTFPWWPRYRVRHF